MGLLFPPQQQPHRHRRHQQQTHRDEYNRRALLVTYGAGQSSGQCK